MIKEKELKVVEIVTITLEVVEQNVCNCCDDYFFGYYYIFYNPTYKGWCD